MRHTLRCVRMLACCAVAACLGCTSPRPIALTPGQETPAGNDPLLTAGRAPVWVPRDLGNKQGEFFTDGNVGRYKGHPVLRVLQNLGGPNGGSTVRLVVLDCKARGAGVLRVLRFPKRMAQGALFGIEEAEQPLGAVPWERHSLATQLDFVAAAMEACK